ncbi:hypothetical protein HCJ58_00855 [Listeria sp. FSL L7-1509]|uniref:Cobalamin biosynthesis protein CbiX n=1 Tax=Listeria immobilis TaxID=2713502 RepID=A0ABR6SU27_9LIST|nr:CbiX/SirB N-terminal domain-containing protein [Listeria immobilis]MBC1482145.1 hypothetical protein [Listeria immobilis]MBC1505536.1 hypothetical protein [Listeria immobilis]MBC1509031.1 hypothetical protein [Listeria immobilis]MBC6303845.1 hypothetical protein [Listeria immobilis]MBC6312358.1 hypothetical protein [Listeria immobilis]
MKKGIVFVLHGRKEKFSTKNMKLVDSVIAELPFAILGKVGLLEGEQQTIEHAMQELLAEKVKNIIFVPVLLFPATHAREDLPERIEAFLHDAVSYQILETLATTKAVERFLVRTIQAANVEDKRAVLLIAHGTPHYEQPYEQLKKLARTVEQGVAVDVYTANHIGQQTYLEFLEDYSKSLLIQPLFLTDGFLTDKIKTTIQTERGTKDTFLPTLQDSDELKAAILERVHEVI